MGVQLIDTIENELLKSAELTGHWEKQLREIEAGSYQASTFITNMKQMVSSLIEEVRASAGSRIIQRVPAQSSGSKSASSSTSKKKKSSKKQISDLSCPKCQEGKILKGKAAYGCSRWKEGCRFIVGFEFKGKKLPVGQVIRLIEKGSTVQLKGFKEGDQKVNGKLVLSSEKAILFEPTSAPKTSTPQKDDQLTCPKCQQGTIVKGKTAYGCSQWKQGCDFRYPFASIRQQAKGQALTRELVLDILTKTQPS